MTTALVAVLALTLGACGDDYDSDLVDALKAQGASQEEAECFIDEIGEDDAQGFLDNIDADSPPENADEIIAALDDCGVEPDGATDGEEPADPSPTADTEPSPPADGEAVDLDAIAGCLEDAGLTATVASGPPDRVDIIGSGTGAVFDYGDPTAAADASTQFIDAFGGNAEFVTGSTGGIAYYYQNDPDEASLLEGCLP